MARVLTVLVPLLWLQLLALWPSSVATPAWSSSPGGTEVSKVTRQNRRQMDSRTNLTDTRVIDTLLTTDKGVIDTAYWFRRLFATKLSPREIACARNATVFYAATGQCAWLFEQGPCAPREWLVMDGDGGDGLRAVCRPRPCAPSYGFLGGKRRCAPEEDLCPEDLVFRYSLFGEGNCHCKGFRAFDPYGECHELFHQGSCAHGQVLLPKYNRSFGPCVGECKPATCRHGEVTLEAMASDTGDGGGADKHCAEFSELDCSVQMAPLLSEDVDIQVPLCDFTQRTIFVAPKRPDRCLRDRRGNCMQVIIISTQPHDWRVNAEASASHCTQQSLIVYALFISIIFSVLLK